MADNTSVVMQDDEIQLLVGELTGFGVILPDKFVVGGIIAKLSSSWRSFATTLKHMREVMTVESLIATLDVEEKARAKDVEKIPPSRSLILMLYVHNGAGGSGTKNFKNKGKEKTNHWL
jgi:hypothetical protein